MAIINNTENFIFIHVPKAAGTTITNIFSKYTTYKDLEIGGTSFGEKIQEAYLNRFGLSKHIPAWRLREIIGKEEFNKKFVFTFVRNPYERVISTYKFLLKWSGTNPDLKNKLLSFKDINEYVNSGLWDEINGPDNIFRPQVFWLTDNNDRDNILIDFIGKVENLEKDINIICSKIDKKTTGPIPKLNETSGNYILSKKSIERINTFYHRDFALLKYQKIVKKVKQK